MRSTFTAIILLCYCLSHSQISINVRNLGAVGDSATINTAIIQRAIDSVTHSGGGEVVIDNGVYISSTIVIKSNVTLRVTTGTTLRAMPNDTDYPDMPYNVRSWSDTYTTHSLIFAEDATNIRITGGGVIDGNGFGPLYINVSKNFRPFGLRIHDCTNVIIDSITLRQAPQWMGHLTGCSNVHINAIKIYNSTWGSNDGIDIDCCRGVLVENSFFDTNDDCLPIKTHRENICRDVLVRNCTMASYERAVKVGNETLGPIVNVRFQDITVIPSTWGIAEIPYNTMYIAVADGGSIDSVVFERINVTTPSNCAIFIRLCERFNRYTGDTFPAATVRYVRNILLKDISAAAVSTYPCSITGLPGFPTQNVRFENVQITVPGGDTAATQTTTIPEMPQTRPEYNIWGNILPAYGLYVRHETGLVLDNYCVDTLKYDPRPLYYFEDTASVQSINQCNRLTGVHELADEDLKIYPNPASDELNITGLSSKAEGLLLYSFTGALVSATAVFGRHQLSVDVSKLSAGIYIMVVKGFNYQLNRKVVIAR